MRPSSATPAAEDGSPQMFKHPVFAREVTTWMQRAEPDDRERFERVFATADADATADLGATATRLTLAQSQPFSLIAMPPGAPSGSPRADKAPHGKPPKPQQHGWTYASTKVAQARPSPAPVVRSVSWGASDQQPPSDQGHAYAQGAGQGGPADPGAGRRPSSAPGMRPGEQQAAPLRGVAAVQAAAAAAGRVVPPPRGPQGAAGARARPPTPRAGSGAGQGAEGEAVLPPMTTYTLAYNMRDMYPDIFDKAVANTRSEPAPNFNFTSDWGDSLKANVDAEWRKKFMKSTYTAGNEDVVSYDLGFDVTKERAFHDWMLKQKTYYGDLLAKEPKAQFEAQFVAAPLEEKRDMLNSLRQTYSVTRPEDFKSHSQAVHCPMTKTEDAQLTALMTEQVRIKTMGKPLPMIRAEDLPPPGKPMAAHAFGPRPASACAPRVDITFETAGAGDGVRPMSASGLHMRKSASAGAATGPLGPTAMGGLGAAAKPAKKKEKKPAVIETQTSKVPMAWPGFLATSTRSAYADAYGTVGHADAPRPASGSKQYQPIRIKETTCPMGAVNPVTAIAKQRTAFPVAEGYVQRLDFPQPYDDKTVYRTDFYSRDEENTVRSMRDAAVTSEFSRSATYKVTLPLGKNGLDTNPSANWKSDQAANFVKHTWDIAGDRARAERMKAALGGPTASTGRLTARHMTMAQRRAEEEAERRAVEAAMQQGQAVYT